MEVKKVPTSGCLQVILGVFTLGVAPAAIWIAERSWPKAVDEQGLETRGGKQIPWGDFTRITRVLTRVGGGTVEHYALESRQGKVVVATDRLEDSRQVLNYIWERLPEQARAASTA